MSKWTHRATAQKIDAPRRNQTRWIDREWRKKPALISYCPQLSHLSLFFSLRQILFFSFFSIPDPCYLCTQTSKGPSTFLIVYDTFGQTCPLNVSCRDTQRRQMIFANIKRIASRTDSSILFNVKVLAVFFFFAICYFFRLVNRHNRHHVEKILFIFYILDISAKSILLLNILIVR